MQQFLSFVLAYVVCSQASLVKACTEMLSSGQFEVGIEDYLRLREGKLMPVDPIMHIWRVGLKTQEQYQKVIDWLRDRLQNDASNSSLRQRAFTSALAETLVCKGMEQEAYGEHAASDLTFDEAASLDKAYDVQRYVISHYWRERKPARIIELITDALKGETSAHNRVALLTDLALAHYWLGEPEQASQVLSQAESEMWCLPAQLY